MLNLNDVESINVKSFCKGSDPSDPCQHDAMIILKNKVHVVGIQNSDICILVHNLAVEKINPGANWSPKEVRDHFAYEIKEGHESPQQVLNRIFREENPPKFCAYL